MLLLALMSHQLEITGMMAVCQYVYYSALSLSVICRCLSETFVKLQPPFTKGDVVINSMELVS